MGFPTKTHILILLCSLCFPALFDQHGRAGDHGGSAPTPPGLPETVAQLTDYLRNRLKAC